VITWATFEATVLRVLGRDIRPQVNQPQHDAISSSASDCLFIVAGPGSGKTTVIALRVLKLIFVDQVHPSAILATTFTKKAAAELRSRILGWGDSLRRDCLTNALPPVAAYLRALDFNLVRTGTLDSIAEELLTDYRAPGVAAPVLLEDFGSNALMLHVGLFNQGRYANPALSGFIGNLSGSRFGLNTPTVTAAVREISDRIVHDQVAIPALRASGFDPGVPIACDAINDYVNELQARQVYDFPRLEAELLRALRGGLMRSYQDTVRFVLVDEYQDTNLLQEEIYLELARPVLQRGGNITVVGDDDQSLYRFRGATVDLFQGFPQRVARIGARARTVHLVQNYRSTPSIVNFVNGFAQLDAGYQAARVAGKPPIVCARTGNPPPVNYPVLGMFRPDVNSLARDLANFLHSIIHGGGVAVGQQQVIRLSPAGGSPADIAFLASSPQDYSSAGNPRLPLLLRRELENRTPRTLLFNPRGQSLSDIDSAQILCGLVLKCIDPNAQVQQSIQRLPREVGNNFNAWRLRADQFITQNPTPHQPTLAQFVSAWERRQPLGRRIRGRENVAINELVYNLVTWIRPMQDDIEHLVYLEAITRTITQSGLFGSFGGEIIFELGAATLSPLARASVSEALWQIFAPIASGAIDVNEDLLDTLPADRISVMSIHQAKGLEFPLVIVDVGSDFKRDHHAQAFKRFPRNPGRTCNMEDWVRPYSQLPASPRTGIDRAFDDLYRQYFVAYSRAEDVLLLVGLNSSRNGIANVATGWARNGQWIWGNGLPNLLHI
jgi:DNA helicase-2/ATP-dependent DNA helicase PcrA